MKLHIGPKFTEVLAKKVVLSTMSGVMGLFHVIVTYATQQMIDEGKPDLVVAFKGGTGTADMVRRAKKHNIKVIEVKDG